MLTKLVEALITHKHRDHWYLQPQQPLDKNITIFCQPVDVEKIKSQDFQQVVAVESQWTFKSIIISRTGDIMVGEKLKKNGGRIRICT